MDRHKNWSMLNGSIERVRDRPWEADHEDRAAILAAALAHLDMLPKTKMVEVWKAECTNGGLPLTITFTTRESYDTWVKGSAGLPYIACIRVLGSFMQEVPAYQAGEINHEDKDILPKTKTVWHVSDGEGSVRFDTADEAYRALWSRLQHADSDVTIGHRTVSA